MASLERITRKKSTLIIIAFVVSIVLYFTGVLSGIFANKVIKEETKQDIIALKQETKQDVDYLQRYIKFLDANLKNMQLEQTFTETLNHDQMCYFLSISLNDLVDQLGFYWSKLPFRLEEYERNNKVTEEYSLLKEEYAHLSIRTWILAKSEYEKCNMNIVHGLYFYSADCGTCVSQGEQIDELSRRIKNSGSSLIMFPIDSNSNQSIVKTLKIYYGIKSTPAVIVNDKVFQGRIFNAGELIKYTKRS